MKKSAYLHLCIHCVQEKGASSSLCPHCGYDENSYHSHPRYLPARSFLKEKYLVGRDLSSQEGGFSNIYIGFDTILQEKVIIKEFFPPSLSTRDTTHSVSVIRKTEKPGERSFEKELELFLGEARILTKFRSHKHVVHVYDYFELNNTGYIVMDFVDGPSLQEFLNQAGGRLSFDRSLSFLITVLDTLQIIHAEGYYHRDISPSNIIIAANNTPVIIDFGTARPIHKTETERARGTMGYTPLEVLDKKGIGPWTDVYSCGAVFYEMLTGRSLPTPTERMHSDDELLKPFEGRKNLGRHISTETFFEVLLRSLSVRKEDRYQSVEEFKAALLNMTARVYEGDLCISCVQEKGNTPLCSYCGYDESLHRPSLSHLPPRFLLQNRFMIGCVLGQGGFGITYVGYDTVLNKKVAIKEFFPQSRVHRNPQNFFVLPSAVHDPSFPESLADFLEEARTLARFSENANIVDVYDFFEENNTGYMVMEFVEGRTLEAFVAEQGGQVEVELAVSLMRDILNILESLHRETLYHCDISPQNIIIAPGTIPVLIDFGTVISKTVEEAESVQKIIKHGFSPLELYSRKNIGPWTDVYSCGATLYVMLSGKIPPDAPARYQKDTILQPSAQLQCNNRRISKKRLDEALLRSLSVLQDDRYQTALEFRQGLESIYKKPSPYWKWLMSVCIMIAIIFSAKIIYDYLIPPPSIENLLQQADKHFRSDEYRKAFERYKRVLLLTQQKAEYKQEYDYSEQRVCELMHILEKQENNREKRYIATSLDETQIRLTCELPPQKGYVDFSYAILYKSGGYELTEAGERVDYPWQVLPISGGSMHSGAAYKILFKPKEDCYVYIFQQDKGKNTFMKIFPTTESSSVKKGTLLQLPAEGQFFRLDENSGSSSFYFLANTAPIDQFERLADEIDIHDRALQIRLRDTFNKLVSSNKMCLPISIFSEAELMTTQWLDAENRLPFYVKPEAGREESSEGSVIEIQFQHK